jgi:hypothetical protein
MNLFIDSISTPCYICIFDKQRKIIAEKSIEVKWNESSKIIPELTLFLKNNDIKAQDIENTTVINGPWSFTWVRTTVLIVNTLNYIINKDMTSLSYFDLFDKYPIIKSSSRRDHFVQKIRNWEIEIIENALLEEFFIKNNIDTVYWETWYDFENIEILEKIDYTRIIQQLELKKYTKIEPLYIKKPNIS